jgi:hypothetical protein
MSSAILRVMTFEKLALTHTCCYQIFEEVEGWSKRPTPDEAKDIYDLERDDIDLLNTLVADFEAKWATYRKPFITFLNLVWKPRMQAIRNERRVDKANLENVGVILREVDPDEDDSDDSCGYSESDWSDWPDDGPEGDVDGWYTTEEEGADEEEEEEEGEADDTAGLGGSHETE